MGLSLRPENSSVHLTDGVKASNIDEKYYEPPLMQVIPSACSACESNKYEVSNMCRGCVAHPCMLTCPKGAISMVDGKSFIDQDKCIHCGRCLSLRRHRPQRTPLRTRLRRKSHRKRRTGTRIHQSGQMRILWHVHGQLPIRSHL